MATLTEPALFTLLTQLVDRYGIKNLVETGTGPESSGLQVADRLGLRGYSCDVYQPCVDAARKRFPDAYLCHGESLGFFSEILPGLEGPTFFWLDGHCPTDLEDLPGPVFPPFEEVQLIKSLKQGYESDILWLDDIPMVDVEGNPVRASWDVYLGAIGTNWHGAKEHSWQEYMDILKDTHNAFVTDSILRYEPR